MATKVQEIELTTTQKIEKLKSDIDKHLVDAEDLERQSVNLSARDPAKSIDLDTKAQATRRLVVRLEAQLADLRAEETRERIAQRDEVIDVVIEAEWQKAQAAAEDLKAAVAVFAEGWNRVLASGLVGNDTHPGTLPYLQGLKLLDLRAMAPRKHFIAGDAGVPALFDDAAIAGVSDAIDKALAATRPQLDRARWAFRAEGRGETSDRSELITDTFCVVAHLSARISEMAEKTGGKE